MSNASRREQRIADDVIWEANNSDLHAQALEEVISELAASDDAKIEIPPTSRSIASQVHLPHAQPREKSPLRDRTRSPTPKKANSGLGYDVVKFLCLGMILLGAGIFLYDLPELLTRAFSGSAATEAANGAPTAGPRRRPIEEIRVGDRLVGRNPLREQADLNEPSRGTWRKLSLSMTKDDGLKLWIDLLRPLDWIEQHHVIVGEAIYIDLPEMGAVGDAQVTYLGPCPAIRPGTGTVVTGTFKHQADETTQVVHLHLEDQEKPTGVTVTHPYWSLDRHDFVEAGELRVGELVETQFGPKRVVSLKPITYRGFLYNLETTEHVYRVDALGTLVHNVCAGRHHFVPRALGSRTPYGHKSLTYLDKAEHTRVQQGLNDFLKNQTKVVSGKVVDMMPRRGNSRERIFENFSKQERLTALSNFYKTFDNGKYHQSFLRELKTATQNDWIK